MAVGDLAGPARSVSAPRPDPLPRPVTIRSPPGKLTPPPRSHNLLTTATAKVHGMSYLYRNILGFDRYIQLKKLHWIIMACQGHKKVKAYTCVVENLVFNYFYFAFTFQCTMIIIKHYFAFTLSCTMHDYDKTVFLNPYSESQTSQKAG